MLGRLSHIDRPPLRQIHAATVLIQLLPPDLATVARSGRRPDHTAAALIKPQLRRSTTTRAAVHSIDHNGIVVV
jgi:hypothetical protein